MYGNMNVKFTNTCYGI